MENPFSVLGIQPVFLPDEALLRSNYLKLQREWHPDFFAADPEKFRQAQLMTAAVNNAYKAVGTFEERVAAILSMHGMTEDSKSSLSQDFLMDMMDIHDRILETAAQPASQERKDVEAELSQLVADNRDAMRTLAMKADDYFRLNAGHRPADLQAMQVFYQKLRYFRRLEKNLQGEMEW